MVFLRPLLIFMAIALSNFMTVGSRAAAAVRCEVVFGKQTDWMMTRQLQAYKGELSDATLKKYGFKVNKNGTLYAVLSSKSAPVELGQLKSLSVDYLFEWSDKENSQAWIKAGGIDYMNSILEDSGQASGKGYYVSVDPFDSTNFGTDLTSFRQTKKIMVLAFINGEDYAVQSLMRDNTKLVRNLSASGIDALHRVEGYNDNWYSIISERVLQNAEGFPHGLFTEYLAQATAKSNKKFNLRDNILSNLQKMPIEDLRQLPEQNPFRRFFLNENMTAQEIIEFIHPLPSTRQENYGPFYLAHAQRLLSEAKTPQDLLGAVMVLKTSDAELLGEIYDGKDQKKLTDLEAFRKKVSVEVSDHWDADFRLLTITRISALKMWVLEAKTTAEIKVRTQWAIETILRTDETVRKSFPKIPRLKDKAL